MSDSSDIFKALASLIPPAALPAAIAARSLLEKLVPLWLLFKVPGKNDLSEANYEL